jgi:hypothetical protein
VPLGYVYDKTIKKLVKDEKTAYIMDFIFTEYDSGKISLGGLVEMINARGFRTAKGSIWSKSALHRVLRNVIYAGKFEYQGQEWQGNHEPYISPARFATRLNKMKIKNVSKRGREFLLKGLLKNGQNGRILTGTFKTGSHNSGEYVYYINNEPYASYREDKIFAMIDKEMSRLEFWEGWEKTIETIITREFEKRKEAITSEISSIQHRQAKLEKENEKLLDIIINDHGETDIHLINRRMKQNREAIDLLAIQKGQKQSTNEYTIANIALILRDIGNFPAIYLSADSHQKAVYLRNTVVYIVVSPDKVSIKWNDLWDSIIRPMNDFIDRGVFYFCENFPKDVEQMEKCQACESATCWAKNLLTKKDLIAPELLRAMHGTRHLLLEVPANDPPKKNNYALAVEICAKQFESYLNHLNQAGTEKVPTCPTLLTFWHEIGTLTDSLLINIILSKHFLVGNNNGKFKEI